MFSIDQILQITQGKALQLHNPAAEIHHLLVDSRKVNFAETSLFFAIKGERHDGHEYIPTLLEKGVRNFIIENSTEIEISPSSHSINLIQVPNVIEALQAIAQAHRQKFNYPVIGITGSNGKTIVKEWLKQLLEADFQIVRSPKSYNSQIGVPLSVWQMQTHHTLAIFEAGISQPNEMQNLQKIIQPSIGIFTNIGTAHDEGFESMEQKIEEKLKLFTDCETIFSVNSDKLSRKGYKLTQNFEVLNVLKSKNQQSSSIDIKFGKEDFTLEISMNDDASIENVLSCLCVLLHLKMPINEIQDRFKRLKAVKMRLELKHGMQNSYLIDDSYNNDWAGLQIALNFMAMQKQKSKRIVILSDLLQTQTEENTKVYKQVGEGLENLQVNTLIGVGEQLNKFKHFFKMEAYFFETTEDFLKNMPTQIFKDALILIKGARRFEFERIVSRLQQKSHGTTLEINLDALVHNLNLYKSLLKPNVKMMAMVKAFAYGSGSVEVAHLLQYHKVNYLTVAYSDEGVFLRQNNIHLPIMVLNPNPATFEQLIEYNLEPEIYSFKLLDEFLDYCNSINKKDFKIHIKIDTGMRRLGFELNEIDKLNEILEQKMPYHACVASIFSHLAAAGEHQHLAFSELQIQNFKNACERIEDSLGYTTLKHILNSPGIVQFEYAQFDMVRLGIGLYGVETNGLLQKDLQYIATFKTRISQIKNIKTGETIGYGRSFEAQNAMQIATIAIGYADGFSRKLSNGVGKVSINGHLAKVIGKVCMDMAMVDVTDIEAQEGDEVIIFGEQPTIFDYAKSLDTIPYEVLTSISERVKRVYYAD